MLLQLILIYEHLCEALFLCILFSFILLPISKMQIVMRFYRQRLVVDFKQQACAIARSDYLFRLE